MFQFDDDRLWRRRIKTFLFSPTSPVSPLAPLGAFGAACERGAVNLLATSEGLEARVLLAFPVFITRRRYLLKQFCLLWQTKSFHFQLQVQVQELQVQELQQNLPQF